MNITEASVPGNRGNVTSTIFSRLRSSSIALIFANLVPLYGVLALGWKVAPILVFYWTENLVVGFFNVLKMHRAQGGVADSGMTMNDRPVTIDSRKGMIFFFIAHYGGFTFCHGIFVLFMFHPQLKSLPRDVGLALLVLLISHGYSYLHNFIGHGEYRNVAFTTLFWQPYVRVVIMHITILIGGVLAERYGSPVAALLVLVGLKTLIDLGAHWLEHKKFSKITHG